MTEGRRRFLALTGPTTSGKTDLAIALAARLPIEIVSMDSRQVYVGMDIGTAKVQPERQVEIPHHGLDLVMPNERYSAGRFGRDARRWIAEIEDRGALPVLAGGTGFFLKAVLSPIFAEPPLEEDRLTRLRRWLSLESPASLAAFATALDPERAPLAIEGGPQRMARTIEVALLTGVPLSRWHRDAPPEAPGVPAVVVVLDLPREEMDRRINDRVQRMVDRGLENEVRELLEAGYVETDPGMSGTGYREMAGFLRGDSTLEEAMDQIRLNTRRYARRQLTWFRHQLPEGAIWIDATRPIEEQVAVALNALNGTS